MRPLLLCGVALRSSWSSTFQSSRQASFAALGEQFERARVEPSEALIVDPVDPGLARYDLFARGPETDVGSELSRCADGGVKASRSCSTSAASSRWSALSRPWLAMAQPFSPSVGAARKEERVRPNGRISGRPRGSRSFASSSAPRRDRASVDIELEAEVRPAGSARPNMLLPSGPGPGPGTEMDRWPRRHLLR